jgi:hypothetical protein
LRGDDGAGALALNDRRVGEVEGSFDEIDVEIVLRRPLSE